MKIAGVGPVTCGSQGRCGARSADLFGPNLHIRRCHSCRMVAVVKGLFRGGVERVAASVVEDVPADRASTPLVVEDEFPNFRGDPPSLPVSFGDARRLSLTTRESVRNGCPDRICRSAQVVGGDVGHCHSLPSCESGKLCGFGQVTSGGVRRECSPVGVTHAHLAAHPGTTDVDSVTRAGVVRLGLLKEMQDVLCAEGCPLRQQPVIFVRQRSAAAHSDQSGVTVGGQDWHELILGALPVMVPMTPACYSAGAGTRPASARCALGSGPRAPTSRYSHPSSSHARRVAPNAVTSRGSWIGRQSITTVDPSARRAK